MILRVKAGAIFPYGGLGRHFVVICLVRGWKHLPVRVLAYGMLFF
jgi:hypothetical protein